jgi:hypothetical protein
LIDGSSLLQYNIDSTVNCVIENSGHIGNFGGVSFNIKYNSLTIDAHSTLTAIPGGIENPIDSGRTYILEGTMMPLPQYAPGTDPLRPLKCGGSTQSG